MHGAVAANELIGDTSRKLVANAMHCKQQTNRPQGMLPVPRKLCVLLFSTLETEERNESDESGMLGNPFLWSLALAGWESAFLSLSAKLLLKSASTFLSAFCLLPRLEGVYIRRVHPHASRHASQKSGLPTRRLGW